MKRICVLVVVLLASLDVMTIGGSAYAASTATDSDARSADDDGSSGARTLQSQDVAAAAGPFHLVFYHSQKCADLPRYSPVNGTQLDQWTCVRQTNEQWYLDYVGTARGSDWFRIRNRASNKCMNISNYSRYNYGRVVQWTCGRYTNEYFALYRYAGMPSGYWLVENFHSGKCLTVKGARRDNGAPLIQYSCGFHPNQYVGLIRG